MALIVTDSYATHFILRTDRELNSLKHVDRVKRIAVELVFFKYKPKLTPSVASLKGSDNPLI